MLKIKNLELDNVETSFLLLKIAFIHSQNFSIGVTWRSNSGFIYLVGDTLGALSYRLIIL